MAEPTSTTPHSPQERKRTRDYSEAIWPKRVKEDFSNTLFASTEMAWMTLEYVSIGSEQYRYQECHDCKYDLKLCNNSFVIMSKDLTVEVPSKSVEELLYIKAKFLYEQVEKIPQMLSCDCDLSHSSQAFTNAQLLLVKRLFKQFYNSYETAMIVGPYTCIGKQFLDNAWAYASLCCDDDMTESNFLFLHNTLKGGPQPGAMYIRWCLPKKPLKSTRPAEQYIKVNERYADNIVYDKINTVNVNVSEVKENEDDDKSISQNNEQMLGLWRPSQKVMLGLELCGTIVRPKVLLLQEEKLIMCYLKEINLKEGLDLMNLLKLMMSFLICVDYCN